MYAVRYIGGSQTGDYTAYKLSRSWVEEEATWTNASANQTWAKAGGDYISGSVASATCPRSVGNTWVRYNVLSAVNEFIRNPEANFGFLIINSRMSQEIDFISSENTTADQRPKLTITYEGSASMTMDAATKTARSPVVVLTRGRDLNLYAPDDLSKIAVYRADGSLVMTCELAAGAHTIVSSLGAGVYVISAGQARERRYTVISIAP